MIEKNNGMHTYYKQQVYNKFTVMVGEPEGCRLRSRVPKCDNARCTCILKITIKVLKYRNAEAWF